MAIFRCFNVVKCGNVNNVQTRKYGNVYNYLKSLTKRNKKVNNCVENAVEQNSYPQL